MVCITVIFSILNNILYNLLIIITECNPICEREENFGLVLQELLPKFNLKRCDVFIIGKIHPKNYGENTEKAFWQTCRNLKTDYLDAYLMQWPGGYNEDPDNDVNLSIRLETWKEMIKLKKNGRVRNIGVCNFDIKHLQDFNSLKLDVPAINQVSFLFFPFPFTFPHV